MAPRPDRHSPTRSNVKHRERVRTSLAGARERVGDPRRIVSVGRLHAEKKGSEELICDESDEQDWQEGRALEESAVCEVGCER